MIFSNLRAQEYARELMKQITVCIVIFPRSFQVDYNAMELPVPQKIRVVMGSGSFAK